MDWQFYMDHHPIVDGVGFQSEIGRFNSYPTTVFVGFDKPLGHRMYISDIGHFWSVDGDSCIGYYFAFDEHGEFKGESSPFCGGAVMRVSHLERARRIMKDVVKLGETHPVLKEGLDKRVASLQSFIDSQES